MEKILFVYRKKNKDVSINRVFDFITPYIDAEKIYYYARYGRVTFFKLIYNILECRATLKKTHPDKIIITGDVHYLALGLPKKKTIIVVHDLVVVERYSGWKKWFHWLLWVYLPLKRCEKIVSISHATTNAIRKYIPNFTGDIIEIPDPVDPNMNFSKYIFNYTCPNILQIGTRDNKNLETVVEAITGLPCKLTIIGVLSQTQIKLLETSKIDYINRYNISDEEIIDEYSKCDMLVFASLYEGFGMPVIEAQQMGRPVICSNIEPMRTVAGKGACLVDPLNASDIRASIEMIIKDEKYRNNLINEGQKNVKRYSASIVAAEYCRVLEIDK